MAKWFESFIENAMIWHWIDACMRFTIHDRIEHAWPMLEYSTCKYIKQMFNVQNIRKNMSLKPSHILTVQKRHAHTTIVNLVL